MSLFVGSLSPHAQYGDLERAFRRFGRCNLDLKDGFAFVIYESRRDADRALRSLQGTIICRERPSISWARTQRPFQQRLPGKGGAPPLPPRRGLQERGMVPAEQRPRRRGSLDMDIAVDGLLDRSDPQRKGRELQERELEDGPVAGADENGVAARGERRAAAAGSAERRASDASGGGRWGEAQSDASPGRCTGEEDEQERGRGRAGGGEKERERSRGRSPHARDAYESFQGGREPFCYYCGKPGHVKRQCRSRPNISVYNRGGVGRDGLDARWPAYRGVRGGTNGFRRPMGRFRAFEAARGFHREIDPGYRGRTLGRQSGERTQRRIHEHAGGRPRSRSRRKRHTSKSRSGSGSRERTGGKSRRKHRKGSVSRGRRKRRRRRRSSSSSKSESQTRSCSSSTSCSRSRSRSTTTRSRSSRSSSYSQSPAGSRSRGSASASSGSHSVSGSSRSASRSGASASARSHSVSSESIARQSPVRAVARRRAGPRPRLPDLSRSDPGESRSDSAEQLVGSSRSFGWAAADTGGRIPSPTVVTPKGIANEDGGPPSTSPQSCSPGSESGAGMAQGMRRRRGSGGKAGGAGAETADAGDVSYCLRRAQNEEAFRNKDPGVGRKDYTVEPAALGGFVAKEEDSDNKLSLSKLGSRSQDSEPEAFGSARLWPWTAILCRRLKRGPITIPNYERRKAQNEEFQIVDKFVRSSSGWWEEPE